METANAERVRIVDEGGLLHVEIFGEFGSMAEAVGDWARIGAALRRSGRDRALIVRHGEGPDARSARDLVYCLRDLGFAGTAIAIVWTNEAASHEKQFIEYLARGMGIRARVCADAAEGQRYLELLCDAVPEGA